MIIYEDENYVLPNGDKAHLIVFDKMVLDLEGSLVNAHELTYYPPDEVIEAQRQETEKNKLISALQETINNKKLLDIDCENEKQELAQLLGY